MYESYKSFLLSQDIFDWLEWAPAVANDDLDTFLTHYDPSDDSIMFDPIELAIAYDAESIFAFLIETYDYSDFYNQVDFSLLILTLMFKREHFLMMALEHFNFATEHMLEMYEYIILYKDNEYFKQFYENYSISPAYQQELLRLSLNNYEIFMYLSARLDETLLLEDSNIIYDLVSFHPTLLDVIDALRDMDEFKDTDLFMNVLQLEHTDSFNKSLKFLLDRGWDINAYNAYGVTLYHQALRFAKDPLYVETLINRGADVNKKTSLGYPPAHQLLLRETKFTLELKDYVDFSAKDASGYTLQDYDSVLRNPHLNFEDILSVVKVVLNMEEDNFYELSEDEFYHIAQLQGIEIFMPYVTLLKTESARLKETYMHTLESDGIRAHDVRPLTDMFPGKFDIDVNKTLQLDLDFWDINDAVIEHFKQFAVHHQTQLIVESEEESINQRGQVAFEIYPSGNVIKRAVVYSNPVDVFYLNFYYAIPIKNITYNPTAKKPERFLN